MGSQVFGESAEWRVNAAAFPWRMFGPFEDTLVGEPGQMNHVDSLADPTAALFENCLGATPRHGGQEPDRPGKALRDMRDELQYVEWPPAFMCLDVDTNRSG